MRKHLVNMATDWKRACGSVGKTGDGEYDPRRVTCMRCRATDVWRQSLTKARCSSDATGGKR